MAEVITPTKEIEYPLRAVIFDIDGTIFPTMNHYYNLQKMIYDKLGDKSKEFLPYSDEWMDNYNKIYAEEGLQGIYTKISHANWDRDEAEIWRVFDKYNSEHSVSPIVQEGKSIADVIKEIYYRGRPNGKRQTRLRLGVNTTKSYASLAPLLESAKLENYFDTMITYDDILKCLVDGRAKQEDIKTKNISELRKKIPKDLTSYLEKPNALSSMLTTNSMGISPKAVIAFEDSVNGVQACKSNLNFPLSAPIYVVGVTWGFIKDKQKLIDAGADAIMHNITDIEPFIEHLGGFYGERR
jgi:phosphoglycolate phosphatase-like HAD superfamily hydrolase